eukprot:g10649.t1
MKSTVVVCSAMKRGKKLRVICTRNRRHNQRQGFHTMSHAHEASNRLVLTSRLDLSPESCCWESARDVPLWNARSCSYPALTLPQTILLNSLRRHDFARMGTSYRMVVEVLPSIKRNSVAGLSITEIDARECDKVLVPFSPGKKEEYSSWFKVRIQMTNSGTDRGGFSPLPQASNYRKLSISIDLNQAKA